MAYLNTIEDHARVVKAHLVPSASKRILEMGKDGPSLHLLHHTLGRFIRNRFGLWEPNHPLTAAWHKGSDKQIVDGVDYSEGHPDAVSMRIIEELWRQLKEDEAK